MTSARSRRWLIALAVSVLAIVIALGYAVAFRETRYREFVRPDGRYHLVVYRRPKLFGMMPGQASDAPGRIEITDASRRVLFEAPLEMVQLASEVLWEPHAVRIPAVGDWRLPD